MRHLSLFLTMFFFSAALMGQAVRKTENVLFVTLDGLRWQELFSGAVDSLLFDKTYTHDTARLASKFWADTPEERRQKLMPFFWSVIQAQGQLYGNRQHGNKVDCSNQMWFSYPGYNEILSGKPDDARINSNSKTPNPNVTVLEHLHRKPAFQGKVAAFGSWDVFPFIINRARCGFPVNAGFEPVAGWDLTCTEETLNKMQRETPSPWNSVRLDAFTHNYAVEHLKKYRPRVLYIAYGETDDFAHDGRYDFYLEAAYNTDRLIAELWEMVQSHPDYRDKTTMFITTDHGRGHTPKETWKHHGIKIQDAGDVWFAVIGPDTPATGEMRVPGQWYLAQSASTVARFLGEVYPEGKPVTQMFRP